MKKKTPARTSTPARPLDPAALRARAEELLEALRHARRMAREPDVVPTCKAESDARVAAGKLEAELLATVRFRGVPRPLEAWSPIAPPGLLVPVEKLWNVSREILDGGDAVLEDGAMLVRRVKTALAGLEARPAPPAPKRKGRGRPRSSDPRQDAKIAEAWKTRQYRKKSDLAVAFGLSENAVLRALDRVEERARRKSVKRREFLPD